MGKRISKGFTIIETMLFLSVTGLLIMGVLIGTGTAVNNQRYRDATESLKSFLQKPYADLGAVRNDRTNTWACDATAGIAEGGTEIRGQSGCLLVGKYVIIRSDKTEVFDVVAREKPTATKLSDIAALKQNYHYNTTRSLSEKGTLEWGTSIAWPKSGQGSKIPTSPRSIAILYIRSPETGAIYTFASNSVPASEGAISSATFTNMIVAGDATPGRAAQTICVESSGMFVGGNTAVYIAPKASSSTAVEIRSNAIAQPLPGAIQC